MEGILRFFRDTLDGPLYIITVILCVILIFACIGYLAERKIKEKKEKDKYVEVNSTGKVEVQELSTPLEEASLNTQPQHLESKVQEIVPTSVPSVVTPPVQSGVKSISVSKEEKMNSTPVQEVVSPQNLSVPEVTVENSKNFVGSSSLPKTPEMKVTSSMETKATSPQNSNNKIDLPTTSIPSQVPSNSNLAPSPNVIQPIQPVELQNTQVIPPVVPIIPTVIEQQNVGNEVMSKKTEISPVTNLEVLHQVVPTQDVSSGKEATSSLNSTPGMSSNVAIPQTVSPALTGVQPTQTSNQTVVAIPVVKIPTVVSKTKQ